MALRRLLLLGLALGGSGGLAHAAPQPAIDVVAAPAWKGWSRPGRTTEIDVRLNADSATRATLDLVAGRQTVHTDFDLQPGRGLRLQMPVSAAATIVLSAGPAAGPQQRRELGIAQSESPLLGVGLASGEQVTLEGFHSIALAADDLPRNAAAYSSIDALIVDAATLGALDQRQLSALLEHAAGCGRVVVLNTDPRLRRVLEGARGCGGQALMSAASPAAAKEMLEASLAASQPAPMAPGALAELARPDRAVWNQVAVALAVYLAVAALAIMFFSSFALTLLVPVLACLAFVALLQVLPAPSQLVVWSEGESGAPQARYAAWQRFQGVARERRRVPMPPQLASSAQPCGTGPALAFDFDARSARMTSVEFDTRLFRQVALCYSGTFPMSRALAIEKHAAGVQEVRNAGTKALPAGVLLAAGRVHHLPALDPGARVTLVAQSGKPPRSAALRTAAARAPADGVAALWELELGGVASVPADSKGWLLVSVPVP